MAQKRMFWIESSKWIWIGREGKERRLFKFGGLLEIAHNKWLGNCECEDGFNERRIRDNCDGNEISIAYSIL